MDPLGASPDRHPCPGEDGAGGLLSHDYAVLEDRRRNGVMCVGRWRPDSRPRAPAPPSPRAPFPAGLNMPSDHVVVRLDDARKARWIAACPDTKEAVDALRRVRGALADVDQPSSRAVLSRSALRALRCAIRANGVPDTTPISEGVANLLATAPGGHTSAMWCLHAAILREAGTINMVAMATPDMVPAGKIIQLALAVQDIAPVLIEYAARTRSPRTAT